MRSLVECCFIPGLTLSATVFPKDPEPSITLPNVDTRLLWQYGVSSPDPLTKRRLAATAKECLYRKLVLKTIQICLSSQLYHTSDFRDTIFMESLINGKKVPLMATLAVSMLNTVLNYEPYGALPYSSYLSNRDEDVVIASCRLLCTVLCYKGIPLASPADPTIDEDNKSSEQNFTRSNTPDSSVPDGNSDPPRSGSRRAGSLPKKRVHRNTTRPRATDSRNAESSYIHSVRSTFVNITLTEAKTILFNYVNIIRLRSYASQTYLPESQHSLASENEFMLLLWKLVDTSPQVQSQLANREDTLLDYLVPLLCYAMDVRKSTQYVYHLQLVVFLLHRLSEKKRFGTICNSPIKESIPFSFPKLSSQSTYVDLIVIAFCLIMKSNDPVFVPYYILCSSIITNIAPFATFLDKDSSAILVYVFAKVTQINLTRPRSDKIYETTMLSLCEAIASILQYHERGSKYLLASLINYRSVIHRAKVAYIDQGTKELAFAGAAPFLVETLEIAVNVCMPIVSSEGALASVQEEKPNDNDSTIHVVTHGVEQNDAVVKKLESVTLVGKTPTPHPIGLRRLLGSKEMDNWATLFLWTTLLDQMGNNCFGDRQSMKLFSSPKR
ncbi:hypothetical protein AGDE_06367 [Angomonas deanei]|uniref:High-temperature-induced dauer-formation protein/Dyggve-Melchior-Clausen syndrome protein, putative n=1 Tax=Angomonas deanei TaxID=59799 RepID=A0A7G2CNU8_9TRYP|nr:hypothetical protein AGDE_06367 [Angomonas deanei]CAD2219852.1 High-temperature-induced dauer-formation protein/Dyggve-Melchior-Clausen syndrome protein, putative [Angomonas deanei]|eukprot:EPY37567.1 hypothetical protein AGDE_06367 [Angomonas deanei]